MMRSRANSASRGPALPLWWVEWEAGAVFPGPSKVWASFPVPIGTGSVFTGGDGSSPREAAVKGQDQFSGA